ncbi:MAG: hypothetical protein C4589_00325 [Peptococcaceae bacterium]|nr:MAG: hypothetical protein C4589_00325 [Peptococcaceae bacterium]
MSKNKVRVGNARCMCHGHYVSRNEARELTSEFGTHDGGHTYIEKSPIIKGDLLYNKAIALFELHDGGVPVDRQLAILREYGEPFKTFTIGNIESNFIGHATVDGKIVEVGDKIYHNGGLIAKSA